MEHKETEPLSRLLPRLAEGEADRLSLAELLERMQDRAHTALLVLFALPNTLPSIPGTSAITGIPLLYLSIQFTLRRKAWLPAFIARRSFPRAMLQRLIHRALPWFERSEKYLHPRLHALTARRAETVIGGVMIVLALAVLLPIPFGNLLPSLAIILLSIGLMEEDGLWVLAGLACTALSAMVFSTLLWGLFKAAVFVAIGAFGWPIGP